MACDCRVVSPNLISRLSDEDSSKISPSLLTISHCEEFRENRTTDEMDTHEINSAHCSHLSHARHRLFGTRCITFGWILIGFLLFLCLTGRSESFEIPNDEDDLEDFEQPHGFRLRRSPEAFQSLKDVENLVPVNYSIHEPPPTEGNATKVNFSVIIMNVRDIKEINEELSLEMNLRMYWRDTRLKHLAVTTGVNTFLVLNPNLLDKIWHPDIFVDHVKSVSQPALISKPASLRIYPESVVRYSARVTITMACQMDFHYYPADTQKCHIDMKSYAYTNKILDLGWREQKGAFLADKLELPNFDVALDNTRNFTTNTSSGSYSTIRFTVLLRRKLSYHLIQTYLPSALFIIVSWLSFLIPPESVPGRMACCMTTLLTLTAMFAAVRQNTPNVSYVKALDIWMVVCIIFVFLTLVEYTVVLKLKSLKPKKKEKSPHLEAHTLSSINSGPAANGRNGSTHSIPTISYPSYGEYPTIQMRRSNTKETTFTQQPMGPHGDVRRHPSEPAMTTNLPPLPLANIPPPAQAPGSAKTPNKFETAAKKLEKFTSTIIPILFIVFNFIYWPWLIERAEYYKHRGAPDLNPGVPFKD
ncbi:unnamed protein product [Allacma fusca]|uniref:Uncharacterized protein n=1 Tax=Allacma fusca TaxID=39272 RepID=A0A8J2PQJ8_9HEXA|nr:unnamed protein product [Allacma fusca]